MKLTCLIFSAACIASALSAEPLERIAEPQKPPQKLEPFAAGKFALNPGETVIFAGPENIVTEQSTGWLELALALGLKDKQPRFRHMGYEGDTVYRQNRMMNWGGWKENLDAVHATTVFAWFGQMEALDATKTPADFAAAYAKFLDDLARCTPRIVIVSPAPFEKPADPRVPDNTARNAIVKQHVEIARKLAAERGYAFVDLYTPLSQRATDAQTLTRDGIHYTPGGMFEVAGIAAQQLGIPGPSAGEEPLRAAIVEKNRLWFNTWRTMNWAFAYGDRTTQPFAKNSEAFPPFAEELNRYRPLMVHADATVHALAEGKPAPAPLAATEPVRADPPAPTPDEELSRFTIREGFAVNLFADEKLGVVRPIQIRWDERGRLWVLCVPSYPQLQPGMKANDCLLILEDTDGDGKADKVTRYAEGLTMPMGFEFGDGGVYVCESTRLIHLRDTTGEGKATERRVVLSGFGTGDSHQNINSVRWGADGCLWFTQGMHNWSYIETPYGNMELDRAGLWRFNPRTLKLDSFLNENSAGLNAWGVIFDDDGQVFHGSGADTFIWHCTPALISTLHPKLLTNGLAKSKCKSMEPEFLGSSHLPDDLRGVLMKSVYFTSQVSLFRLRDDGSSFLSTDLGDLIASSGKEFRPVESRVGPDGAIYVCDWLNPIIGHYQASYRDPRRDLSHGRIWRAVAKGRPLLQRPPLEKMDSAKLLEQLASPERWVRDQAKYALYRKPKAEAIPAADALLATLDGKTPESARMLYEISGVFCAHEEPRRQIIDRLLASTDFHRRCWGTRLIGYWAKNLPNALALLTRCAGDEHPRVRMEAVVAASMIDDAEAIKVATLVLDKPMDYAINYALTQCTYALAPRWEQALEEGKLNFGTRMAALRYLLTTVSSKATSAMARRLIDAGKIDAETRDGLLVPIIDSGVADDLRYAIDHSSSPETLTRIARMAREKKRIPSGDLNATLDKLLTNPDAAIRSAAYGLASAWQVREFLERAKTAAENANTAPEERSAAMEAYAALAGKEGLTALKALASDAQPAVRNTALAVLAPLDIGAAATRAATLLGSIQTADEAAPLLKPIITQNAGPAALGKALTETKPSAAAANAALQWLAFAGRDDAPLIDALNAAAGIVARNFEYSPELVAKYVAQAKAGGDAKRGGVIFHKKESSCLGCHKVGNEGGILGPELSAVGRAMTPELIVEAILWPKRQVKEGFLLTILKTKDGRHFQGYKISESPEQLVLKDLTGGPNQTFLKSEISKRTDAGTLMPDGLAAAMSDEQIGDLVRYLMELGPDAPAKPQK